jgi:hypothetical protein
MKPDTAEIRRRGELFRAQIAARLDGLPAQLPPPLRLDLIPSREVRRG